MSVYNSYRSLKLCLADKKEVLAGFGIEFTKGIEETITNLYPNEIAIEHYTRKLINDWLSRYDKVKF